MDASLKSYDAAREYAQAQVPESRMRTTHPGRLETAPTLGQLADRQIEGIKQVHMLNSRLENVAGMLSGPAPESPERNGNGSREQAGPSGLVHTLEAQCRHLEDALARASFLLERIERALPV